ncbi:blastoderm-specific protein 25D, partial [Ostrinia nubilalis]|uniref:blastoderm-specific protein 25D n=1 Tax=Ostrinia nubilalis TaxID=29057 RepID=UPI003082455C
MRLLAMDSTSMNPYEQQLYTVFKTFDVDNEEALNKSAVLDLCDALQLEDRGAALVGSLFERSSDRVTFTQFRNGLLSVLSGDGASAPATSGAPSAPPGAPHSDEDSSGREIAPKFVFGSKKYGRRSRPQRASDAHAPRAASVSRLDADDGRARSSQRMRARRSASAMEARDLDPDDDDDAPAFEHERRVDRAQALALCRDLRMDGIDGGLVDRIFEEARAGETTTVGEFFDRLNATLTSSIEGAGESAPTPEPDGADPEDDDAGVASELVVDAWERAGVPRPRRLLLELGFGAAAVRPPDLERALDTELTALAEPLDERRDARPLVLAAALALARLRLRRARRRADLAAAERDKLRADVAEANRRALLLAQDVDETHARMEAELTASLRRAEARHAEAARRAADELAAERERAAAL